MILDSKAMSSYSYEDDSKRFPSLSTLSDGSDSSNPANLKYSNALKTAISI